MGSHGNGPGEVRNAIKIAFSYEREGGVASGGHGNGAGEVGKAIKIAFSYERNGGVASGGHGNGAGEADLGAVWQRMRRNR